MTSLVKRLFSVLAVALSITIGGVAAPAVASALPTATPATSRASTFIGGFVLNNQYQTVYTKNNDRNGTITIQAIGLNSLHHLDVRYLGVNGNVIWERYGVVDSNATQNIPIDQACRQIQVRVASKNVFGEVFQERGECNVWVELD